MNISTHTTSPDWHAADIQAQLKKLGWTLRQLSFAHDYSSNVCNQTLRRPWPAVEKIIATALGRRPWEIWPSRYDAKHQPIYKRPTAPLRPYRGSRNSSRSAHEHNV